MLLFSKLASCIVGIAILTCIQSIPVKVMKKFGSVTCTDVYLSVALVAGEASEYQVFGQLCSPSQLSPKKIQVLVTGATYDHSYWDWPYEPERYSYVKALTKAGYATFAIDGIGVGNSSHPDGDLVTLDSDAYVLHQIIQNLRNGQVNDELFQQVEVVGHSLGSLVAINEVSKYHDVDAVILTGFLHNLNPDVPEKFANAFYPAQLDPRFVNKNLPPGYLTTVPGVRGQLYYNLSDAEPEVIEIDEKNKETITTGENASGSAIYSDVSKQIQVPVLVVVGQNDGIYCSGNICNSSTSVAAAENLYFSSSPHLDTFVLPQAGHVINLHLNAPVWYEVARQWSDEVLKQKY